MAPAKTVRGSGVSASWVLENAHTKHFVIGVEVWSLVPTIFCEGFPQPLPFKLGLIRNLAYPLLDKVKDSSWSGSLLLKHRRCANPWCRILRMLDATMTGEISSMTLNLGQGARSRMSVPRSHGPAEEKGVGWLTNRPFRTYRKIQSAFVKIGMRPQFGISPRRHKRLRLHGSVAMDARRAPSGRYRSASVSWMTWPHTIVSSVL